MDKHNAEAPSNTAVDRAGDALRRASRGEGVLEEKDLEAAYRIVSEYRAAFVGPGAKVTDSVREIVRDVAGEKVPTVASRLKTTAGIEAKLLKLTTRLSQFEDIAGCRAVLPSLRAVHTVAARLCADWNGAVAEDKNRRPNDTGYRAVHVVVPIDGMRVEVQLRTENQARWADTVEEWGARLGINRDRWNLKDGEGPEDLVLYFRLAADRFARVDAGQALDDELEREFGRIRGKVGRYFKDSQRVEPPWEN